MELSSFTIEFPEHVPHEKRQYCLDRLSDCGAAVEQVTEREFRVLCSKPNQLTHVGLCGLVQCHIDCWECGAKSQRVSEATQSLGLLTAFARNQQQPQHIN